ncbi:hypothetical protein BOO36_17700, partial [Vibrio navarrensis]|nr:hypothetical protein [Vibrio navarrensis]
MLISLIFVIQVAHCAIEVVVQYKPRGVKVRTLVYRLVVVSSKGVNELDLSLVKMLLILLAYCFPLAVAIISLLFIKKLSPKECIFSGLFIIVLAALVMPLVTAMKGMDDFYQQKELLNAFEVVVKNQEILASKSYGGESVM